MSVQRLHAFEKTSIQARHTLKRLEAMINSPHATEYEREIARRLLGHFDQVRSAIPKEYQDVDLEEKE